MKNVREILQSYCIIILGLIDITLLLRFFLNFYGVDDSQKFIKIIFSLSNIFYGPFQGTFESVQTSESMITDFSVIVGVVVYTTLALIFLSAIKIFFRWDIRNKISSWLGIFFKFFILLNIFRFVLTLLNASESTFTNILKVATAFTVFPIKAMIPSAEDETVDLGVSIGISIVLLCLIWYTVDRILKSSIEKKAVFESKELRTEEKTVEESEVEERIVEKNKEVGESSERPLVYVPLSQQQRTQTTMQTSEVSQTNQLQQSRTIPEQPFMGPTQPVQQITPSANQIEPQPTQKAPTQTNHNVQSSEDITQQNEIARTKESNLTEPPEEADATQEESKTNQSQGPITQGRVGKIKSFVKKMTEKEEKTFDETANKDRTIETPKSPLS